MEKIKKFGFIAYWLLVLADIYFIFDGLEVYRRYTKPFLVPILIIIIIVSTTRRKFSTSKYLVLLALFAATLGDILLLGTRESSFMLGLISFFIMQVLYIIYFLRLQPITSPAKLNIMAPGLVMVVVSIILITFLRSYAGQLLWHLVAYAIVLSIMLITAVNTTNNKLVKQIAGEAFIPGAALFVLSDIILALNKFYFQEGIIGIAVMATYTAAQYYFTTGFIRHLRARKLRIVGNDEV